MKFNRLYSIVLLFAISVVAKAQSYGLIINEVMANNLDVYLDASCNYGSWFEVYNPTDNYVDLRENSGKIDKLKKTL